MPQKVIELVDFGPSENMRVVEADIPDPGPDQIIVKNKAKIIKYLFIDI